MNQKRKYNVLRDLAVYVFTDLRHELKQPGEKALHDIAHFPAWWRYRSGGTGDETIKERSPWLVFSAIEFLKSWLKKDMKVFEFGSGGSTFFFASRAREVVSVEHDGYWFGEVDGILKDSNVHNVTYLLKTPEDYPGYDVKKRSDPAEFISYYHGFEGKQFKRYAQAISDFPDGTFDLVVVDGRARISCIHQALSKIKQGGFLLVDNADRPAYLLPFTELENRLKWKKKVYTGHYPMCPASVLDRTVFFKKLF